ncbi:ABC transporter permease [Aliivibrio kagoshimensis]|uniref:ABC transporter permease n=1 Tax=Aliivibrio kagoshimensis TaxID=2910230 RepID=UPI003D109970
MWWELQGYWPQLIAGTWITLQLAFSALLLGLFLGLLGAACSFSTFKPLAIWSKIYSALIRGTPELLGVLIIYFGASMLIQEVASWFDYQEYIEVGPFLAGTLALGLAFGGYASEVFRGAFLAIPQGQWESAAVLGLSRPRTYIKIILPQVWRYAMPGLGNLFLILLKDTALISVIGLQDLMRETSLAVAFTREPFTFYFSATLIYLLLTWVSMRVLAGIERYSNRGIVGGM